MASPVVSVCIPAYNGGPYLLEAVRSVLLQTWADFELLVLDDGSTDGSVVSIETLEDSRLVIHRTPVNRGPEKNWNHALAMAKGTYVKVLHQDDLLAPDCLVRQVEALELHPEAVLAFSSRSVVGPNGKLVLTRRPPFAEGRIGREEVVRALLRTGTNPIGEPSSVMVRRDAVRRVGGFDGQFPYLIDLDYWLRLLEGGDGVCQLAPLASFRLSRGQWSAALGKAQARQFMDFVEALHGEGRIRAGRRSLAWARMMAWRNQILRGLVHYVVARKD